MKLKKKPASEALHYAMFGEPAGNRHTYDIFIGTTRQLCGMTREHLLFGPRKISRWPQKMARAMKSYHSAFQKKMGAGPARCGRINFRVSFKGGKKVAYAEYYNPKSPGSAINTVESTTIPGIRGALLEAERLEHLKAVAEVTHMTTHDGFDPAPCNATNTDRRNQLVARGLDPLKTYPIDDWISKLRSEPEYSRAKPLLTRLRLLVLNK